MLKYSIIAFWTGFSYSDNIFTNNFCKNHLFTNNYNEADFLIIGCFLYEDIYNLIKTLNCKKILFNTEPIEHISIYEYVYKMYLNNDFYYILGCINNDIFNKRYKYPLYILFIYPHPSKNLFDSVNYYVKNSNIKNKEFCCLINRHDNNNTRTNIYNILKNIDNISCPSNLFNNCSNNELNTIGNIEYIKKYIFNICPENCFTNINGYITEKLLNCCLGGAIPIYYGWFDEYDEKIFNKNRILFYDPLNDESINNIKNKILFLLQNDEELIKFYQQDVFNEEAFNTFNFFDNNLYNILNY